MPNLEQAINFCNKFFTTQKNLHPYTQDEILKSALIYQFLYVNYLNEPISFNQILEKHPDIGLIGPGSCTINTKYQFLIKHAIFHDAFGRFFQTYEKGPGYTYCCHSLPKKIKRSPLMGQFSGILYCLISNPKI